MTQFLIISIKATTLSIEEQEYLKHQNVGGVILFSRNFISSRQLKELCTAILAINNKLIIMCDNEGGQVMRFSGDEFRSIPEPHSFGNTYDTNPTLAIKNAHNAGSAMAKDVKVHGLDLSLAPVIDLHDARSSIIARKERAFHHDPEILTKIASSFITGMHSQKMLATGKHFPGHGRVSADSHLELPISTASLSELKQLDLYPFARLIENNLLAAIMPAHVIYEEIDAKNTACFSKIWLEKILREELKFDNIIMSDCITMKGAGDDTTTAKIQKALDAGCDMVIANIYNYAHEKIRRILDTTFKIQPQSFNYTQKFRDDILANRI